MAKVTFSLKSVVQIEIKGQTKKGTDVLMDDGLVHKLIAFLSDEKIFPAVRGGMFGAGRFTGYYSEEDAKKIEQWLIAQKAKKKS